MARIVDEEVLDRELNPEQAAAAKKIDGPMLILAGAGSGKTRAITYKIAHLVSRHHVEPGRVLAVTFTNKAAREMTGRIQKLLDCDMRFPWMGTFHSVCLRLLKRCLNMEAVLRAFGGKWYDANFSIYDDDDQKRILKQILKEDLGDECDAAEIKRVHGAISRYKNTVLYVGGCAELQTPDVALSRAEFADEERYARYYAEYQKRLLESNAMDFDDLLFNTVLMLQRVSNLAEQLQSHFDFVVVDEYQDTNDVQYELLKLLINDQRNVTVVGDDDQSIYGWRGANIKIIRNFHRDFAPVTIVKLERNYRSTSNIVKGAGSVIAHNIRPAEMEKNVFSKEEAGDPIRVRHLVDDRSEAQQIAENISVAGEANFSKTAIFYRTNRLFSGERASGIERKSRIYWPTCVSLQTRRTMQPTCALSIRRHAPLARPRWKRCWNESVMAMVHSGRCLFPRRTERVVLLRNSRALRIWSKAGRILLQRERRRFRFLRNTSSPIRDTRSSCARKMSLLRTNALRTSTKW